MHQEQVIRWLLHEMMAYGRTAAEVCRDHGDLLGEVQQRWRRVAAVEAHIVAGQSLPLLDRRTHE